MGRRQKAIVRPTFACPVLLLLVAARAETVQYSTIERPRIEERLRAAPRKNPQREPALAGLFRETGCADRLSEQRVKHSKSPNVICVLPGESGRIIIVGAHFDFVDRGSGVIDNWSGASLLPSLYQSLKTTPRRHTFVFIGFTDEEKGLVGSRYYVSQMEEDGLRKISAMVNLDSLGTSYTKVELDRGDKVLAKALDTVALNFKLPLSVVNVHRVGMSDSDSFQDRKVPTIAVHSITQQTLPLLHSRGDQIGAIHMDDYYDSYRLLTAYLAYLDKLLDKAPQ